MAKIVSIPLAIIMSILSFLFPSKVEAPDKEQWNTNYPYVFVHGLMGWGEYDARYKLMPYWGMFGGEIFNKLEDKGYECYGASVSGTASAWDRACELYAQLTGTVVDYGKAHSEKCGHDRYGKDFDAENITAGVWNIMPVYQGDHMSLQGGFFKVNTDVERLYTEHFDMINGL